MSAIKKYAKGLLLSPVFLFVCLLIVWELVSRFAVKEYMEFFSSPIGIIKAGSELLKEGLGKHVWISFEEFAIGMAIAIVTGVPVGLALGHFKRLRFLCEPLVIALYTAPRISILPILIVGLGIGMQTKAVIIFVSAFFPLVINTMSGVIDVDKSLITAAQSFGANQTQIFTKILLPGTVPYIISGLRLSFGVAVVVVIVAEMYASAKGMGYLMSLYGSAMQNGKLFFLVVLVILFSLAGIKIISFFEKKTSFWRND